MHCRSEETYDETRVETGGQAGWNMMSTWAYEHIEHVWAYEDMSLWAYEHMSIWAHEQCSLSILSIWVYWAYEHIDPMSIRAYEHMSRATYDETRWVSQPATQGRRRGAESCCRPSEQQQQKQQWVAAAVCDESLTWGQVESHMGKATPASGTRRLSSHLSQNCTFLCYRRKWWKVPGFKEGNCEWIEK